MKIELAALIGNRTMQCKINRGRYYDIVMSEILIRHNIFGTFLRSFYKQSRDEPWDASCHRVATAFSNKILPARSVHFFATCVENGHSDGTPPKIPLMTMHH
jgi:hypothetical protein